MYFCVKKLKSSVVLLLQFSKEGEKFVSNRQLNISLIYLELWLLCLSYDSEQGNLFRMSWDKGVYQKQSFCFVIRHPISLFPLQ